MSEEDDLIDDASHVLALPSLKKRVLVLGLDGAGKSTLLGHLTDQPFQSVYQPTDGVKMVDLATRNCTYHIWEGALMEFMTSCGNVLVQELPSFYHRRLKTSR